MYSLLNSNFWSEILDNFLWVSITFKNLFPFLNKIRNNICQRWTSWQFIKNGMAFLFLPDGSATLYKSLYPYCFVLFKIFYATWPRKVFLKPKMRHLLCATGESSFSKSILYERLQCFSQSWLWCWKLWVNFWSSPKTLSYLCAFRTFGLI